MIYLIRFITKILSYIIPIDQYRLIFVSFPDFGDNSYAVFKYMVLHKKLTKYKYYWLIGNQNSEHLINDIISKWNIPNLKVKVLKRKSIKGIWNCYRARYIFNTVGIFTNIVFHQHDKRINMWHGMPIKHIQTDFPNGDITLATSKLFVRFMAEGLKIPENKVLVIGQPRNDLFYDQSDINENLRNNISEFKHIGFWLPTYRKSIFDSGNTDGEYDNDKIAFLYINQLQLLNDFLKNKNTLLLIKPHPLDMLQNREFETYSNIKILKNASFKQHELYPLLGMCDFLITDYSSVLIDFEMLGKSIGVTMHDIEQYKSTRGFCLQEFPGFRIHTYDELLNFIDCSVSGNQVSIDYGTLYNEYRDAKSAKRLLEYLKIID